MSKPFTLSDPLSLEDLRSFAGRAARVEEGSVRLIAGGGVLAAYAAVLYPIGLLDEAPTVLGLRTYALTDTEPFDVVVPVRSLLQRLERSASELERRDPDHFAAPVDVSTPIEVHTVTWAAISPPRGGWVRSGTLDPALLQQAAEAGIAEVAEAVPEAVGESIVRKVRGQVWSRPVDELDHIPAGAGFAALSLGFLGEDEVAVFESGPWTRLTTKRGHVLVKRKPWTLAR
ncbi:hypothetical protein [Schumannella soli]|uniref:Uncharacterized protein n=1 Tax=Schumannella soli TaxID=2590779 RepID=A0A506XY96_9MICO|nr:hypothetical protein [Schumannella soli]TPW74583.1 hypothetical protein FJ657_13380 [Schumannella soli]